MITPQASFPVYVEKYNAVIISSQKVLRSFVATRAISLEMRPTEMLTSAHANGDRLPIPTLIFKVKHLITLLSKHPITAS